jgi:pyruvate ferredoxin oxidoreductase beta subunit
MKKLTQEEKELIKFAKALTREEYFERGHRACQGCGPALGMRLITKALGKDTVVSMVTGCMEIISSYYPDTAWHIPWLHAAFEVAASVASGMETGFKALMRKGKLPEKEITVVAIGGDGGNC